MKWKQEYATGNDLIDEQHKTIFAASEDFREVLEHGCSSDTYKGFLEFLAIYVETHFGYEEACMFAKQCPFGGQNQKEHAIFMVVVKEEQKTFDTEGFKFARAVKLLDTIDAWLDSHIVRVDVHLKDEAA